MLGRIRVGGLASVGALMAAAGFAATGPTATMASGTYVCSGSVSAPGVLAGSFFDVQVQGVCFVNGGPALVHGKLTVRPGSALVSAFALNDVTGSGTSSLTVNGDLTVDRGGALVMGCLASSFACLDDPDQNNPTLASHDRVGGDLVGNRALGMVVHNSRIGGNVMEQGGGSGLTCNPSGIFAAFGSPAYTDTEDSVIVGSAQVTNLTSCWMGFIRNRVGGDVRLVNDQFADTDAIEILSNHVGGNLVCHGDSSTWDSADLSEHLFPRIPEPNTVAGTREGQCVLSSPTHRGGQPGPGAF
jgi:hypothetical protein